MDTLQGSREAGWLGGGEWMDGWIRLMIYSAQLQAKA